MSELQADSKQLPIVRLVLLFFATFGVYLIGWFFHTNDVLRWRGQKNPHEILFFFPIANVFAFHRQLTSTKLLLEKMKHVRASWSVGWLTALFVIVLLLQGSFRLIESVSQVILIATWNLLLLLPIIPVQLSLNSYLERMEKRMPDWAEFTRGQLIWFVAGGMLWILVVLTTIA